MSVPSTLKITSALGMSGEVLAEEPVAEAEISREFEDKLGDLQITYCGQLYRRIGIKPHVRSDGSVTQLAMCPVSAVRANASGLPDQVCDESAGEAHHKDGCGYHEDQVDGPRVIAFAHKVDVSSATFVSIDVKVHSSGLRQGLLRAEYHLLRPSWGGIGARDQK